MNGDLESRAELPFRMNYPGWFCLAVYSMFKSVADCVCIRALAAFDDYSETKWVLCAAISVVHADITVIG